MDYIIAVTGHRPDKIGGYDWENPLAKAIRRQLQEELLNFPRNMISHAILGMAQGVDQYFADVCISLEIPWTAAIPFPGQESVWKYSARKKYNQLLERATRTIYVSEEKPTHKWDAVKMLHARNKWMVDNSNSLIAVYNGDQKGGTYNCVSYAQEVYQEQRYLWTAESKIVYINPKDLKYDVMA
jgi:uncharacterized phage-like protein YoqJ